MWKMAVSFFCLLMILFITFQILDVFLYELSRMFSLYAFFKLVIVFVSLFLYFLFSCSLTGLLKLFLVRFLYNLFFLLMDFSISFIIQGLDFSFNLPVEIFLFGTFWSEISLILFIK